MYIKLCVRLYVIISSTPVGNLSQSHNLYCNTITFIKKTNENEIKKKKKIYFINGYNSDD